MLVAVIDGLGHGGEAAIAARAAVSILERCADATIIDLVQRSHESMRQTRGAAMSLALFNIHDATMTWVGVGNVEGLLLRANPRAPPENLLLRSGLVGSHLPALHSAVTTLQPDDIVVFATDGIASDFALTLAVHGAPEIIADRIMAKSNRGVDDALVLVARYRGGAV
jgi:serine phosphatase RsbU (regulator of sigma subunit)